MEPRWAKVGRGLTWYNGGVLLALIGIPSMLYILEPLTDSLTPIVAVLVVLWLLGTPVTATAGFFLCSKAQNRRGKWINGLLFVTWALTFCASQQTLCGPREFRQHHHCGR